MKLRVRYSKLGKVRFVGNLDVTRIWERALRKAELPVAYSTGFSPRPRLSFGLALPMAAESVAEYLDVEFAGPVTLDGLAGRLTDALPTGFAVQALAPKADGEVSLQEAVVACDWRITLVDVAPGEAADAASAVMAAASLPLERERKGERRVDDVRPAIEAVAVTPGPEHLEGSVTVEARLATVGRGVRPSELVAVMFPGRVGHTEDLVRGVLRTEQWIERDGARREVLPAAAAVPTPTPVGV